MILVIRGDFISGGSHGFSRICPCDSCDPWRIQFDSFYQRDAGEQFDKNILGVSANICNFARVNTFNILRL